MGLSQGAYVSKKLVPTFKLNDIKADKQQQLNIAQSQLQSKQDALKQNIAATQNENNTPLDKLNLKNLNNEVTETFARQNFSVKFRYK